MGTASFVSLATELHYCISEYLTAQECRNISHCCNLLQKIYRPIAYEQCKISLADGIKDLAAIPLDVMVNSSHYSWFPSARVLSIEVEGYKDKYETLHRANYEMNIPDTAFTSLYKIKFHFVINYEAEFFFSPLFTSIQKFVEKNDQFNLDFFYQVPIQMAMSDLTGLDFPINYTNITRLCFLDDCFSPTYVTFIPDLIFPCLEYVIIRNSCPEEPVNNIQNYWPKADSLFMNRVCTMILTIIARSPQLKSVHLDIQRFNYSSCKEILKNGVSRLPENLQECHIKLSGAVFSWWQTTHPTIDKDDIQVFPQVTSLDLEAFIGTVQQYRFPRAESLRIFHTIEHLEFLNFNDAVDMISYLNISMISECPMYYYPGLVKSLPYFKNTKQLEIQMSVKWYYYFEKPTVDDLVYCARKVVSSCLDLDTFPEETALKSMIMEISKRSIKKRILRKYNNGIRTNELTANLIYLYLNPTAYLLTTTGMIFFEETNPYVILCFQEALYSAVSELPKLEYFTYRPMDITYSPTSIVEFYPYLPSQNLPSLSFQKLVGPLKNGNNSALKQVLIEYSSNFGNDDIKYLTNAQKLKFDSKQIAKIGTFDNGKLILSEYQKLTPRQSKIYTFKHTDEKHHGLSVLFDFQIFEHAAKSVAQQPILVTDIDLKRQYTECSQDWLTAKFDGWV